VAFEASSLLVLAPRIWLAARACLMISGVPLSPAPCCPASAFTLLPCSQYSSASSSSSPDSPPLSDPHGKSGELTDCSRPSGMGVLISIARERLMLLRLLLLDFRM
jgi:hypothetical protein